MDKNKITGYIAVALASAAATFGVSWFALDYCRRDEIKLGKELGVINECVEILKEKEYPMEADGDPVQEAVQGYMSALSGDKYTGYIVKSSETDEMTAYVNTAGTAVASGFQIGKADYGNILLTEVKPGLAADKQGLREGDEITAINGDSVKKIGYENIANKMLGKQDTEVTFTVLRDGEESDIKFVRDHIYINSCDHELRGDVEYVRFNHIEQFAKGQFDQALEEGENTDKLIIDLRDCPGGNMQTASFLTSQICGYCKVVCTDYKNKETQILHECEPKCKGKKIIVLVNEKTASAAEIMTAALMQSGMVKTVGTNTFGKGIFQETVDLSNGAKLRYTLGTYTVGDWECYQGVGIAPDVEVPMDRELIGTDDDIQLKKALELLD